MSDLHVRIPGQDEIASAPCITFAQVRDLAKTLKTDLAAHFKGEVPAEVFAHALKSTVVPYWPVIDWYVQNTTRACRCGCGTRLPESQAFATPTCRTRLSIMKDRKPDLYRRRRSVASKNSLRA
jgi:hypothetical protein